jgi:hypothetical protein
MMSTGVTVVVTPMPTPVMGVATRFLITTAVLISTVRLSVKVAVITTASVMSVVSGYMMIIPATAKRRTGHSVSPAMIVWTPQTRAAGYMPMITNHSHSFTEKGFTSE